MTMLSTDPRGAAAFGVQWTTLDGPAVAGAGATPSATWLARPMPYLPALAAMEAVQAQRRAGAIADMAVYLEHEAVVTYGRATPPGHLGWGSQSGVPAVAVPRGGLATYHGPGQLVGYLFLDLAKRAGGAEPDLHAYLRAIEDGLMAACEAEFGLPCVTRPGFTGVWTHGFDAANSDASGAGGGGAVELPRKVAAIGVACRRWITAHGFALNVASDLSAFRRIVPCGITDAETTSVEREHALAGRDFAPPSMKELAGRVHVHLTRALRHAGWCRSANPDAEV